MTGPLEHSIAAWFRRKHCVLVGSGTTAIYVTLEALDLPPGFKILYPDVTCETAVNAAVYAGLSPAFGDVELSSFNLDLDQAVRLVHCQDVGVIVATHIFGHVCDIPRLRERLANNGVFVLEDAAQAYGGELRGSKAGAMGDASIISFGSGKLLDCGGGGAILTDSDELCDRCRHIARGLQRDAARTEQSRRDFMRAMFTLTKSVREPTEFRRCRDRLKREHRNAYLCGISDARVDALSRKFHTLEETAHRHRQRADALHGILSGAPDLVLPKPIGASVPWRYSFLVRHGRDDLLDALIDRGVRATRYFRPLHTEYGEPDAIYPNSMSLYDRIINIDVGVDGRAWRDVRAAIEELVEVLVV
ncbi:MAG: DegT/DnrJ/EryC1/StrS family aminotransferase [Phycisphaerales bacterium]|nr:MAG: DegT/DnrJ/EryC1/StrS family aminotransferase [Phycisphaerales bacterium]